MLRKNISEEEVLKMQKGHAERVSASHGLILLFIGILFLGMAYLARYQPNIFYKSLFFPGYFGNGLILTWILIRARANHRDRKGITFGLWDVSIRNKEYLVHTQKVSMWLTLSTFGLAAIYVLLEYLFSDLLYDFIELIMACIVLNYFLWSFWWCKRGGMWEHLVGIACAMATLALLGYTYASNTLLDYFDNVFGLFSLGCIATGFFLHLRWRRWVHARMPATGWFW